MRKALPVVLLLLVACKTQATKESRARDELTSWASAGQMLSRGWARGDAQTPYVKSTAKVASDEVGKLRQDLQNDKESVQSVDRVSTLYAKLSQAIAQEDRRSADAIAREFARVTARLQQQKSSS